MRTGAGTSGGAIALTRHSSAVTTTTTRTLAWTATGLTLATDAHDAVSALGAVVRSWWPSPTTWVTRARRGQEHVKAHVESSLRDSLAALQARLGLDLRLDVARPAEAPAPPSPRSADTDESLAPDSPTTLASAASASASSPATPGSGPRTSRLRSRASSAKTPTGEARRRWYAPWTWSRASHHSASGGGGGGRRNPAFVHFKGFTSGLSDAAAKRKATGAIVAWLLEVEPKHVAWDGDEYRAGSFTEVMLDAVAEARRRGLELALWRVAMRGASKSAAGEAWDDKAKEMGAPMVRVETDVALGGSASDEDACVEHGLAALAYTQARHVVCVGGGRCVAREVLRAPDGVDFWVVDIARRDGDGSATRFDWDAVAARGNCGVLEVAS